MMKERELREPIAQWFRDRGFYCAYERLFPSGYCDILAFRFEPQTSRSIPTLTELIAVELKLRDVAAAITQARGYAWSGARSFVAMPENRIAKMRLATLDKFRENEVGLISVGDVVSVVHDAPRWEHADNIAQMNAKVWRIKKELDRNSQQKETKVAND